ncbi:MAG: hypothetical protein AAF489_12105 [Bacteroidota bacterium]
MQRLSTSLTYFYKIVLPIIYVVLFSGLFFLLLSLDIALPGLVSFLISAILFSLIFLLHFYGIKKVSIDNRFLYVSNFKKEIQIPLAQINSVKENVWFLPRKITVRLETPCPFGGKITFLGYYETFLFFKTHPAVLEIRERINKT